MSVWNRRHPERPRCRRVAVLFGFEETCSGARAKTSDLNYFHASAFGHDQDHSASFDTLPIDASSVRLPPLLAETQNMPNIAAVLKTEISRIARKEVRKDMLVVRKLVAGHRHEIAALKRTVASLERRNKTFAKMAAVPRSGPTTTSPETPVRFVAKGLRSLRVRLDLSAPELARLLSVSTQSIYNWELKKTTPRKEQLAAIVALRALGRKEVRGKLDALISTKSSNARPGKRRTR